ncbi:MAG: nitroreductase [Coriobacteriaceae bacterium]|jgi:nitroreductase|nr:nitroreductase [Coriobacteriaceae bacterium]
MSVLDAITTRRSIREYTSASVDSRQLEVLLNAALQSPSAHNDQPWHFTVVRSREIMDDISAEASRVYGRDLGDIFYAAPVAIFISYEADSNWGFLDSGIAVENIALAATGLGLGSVILGYPLYAFKGHRGPDFEQLLEFPKGYRFAIAIAIGHPARTKSAHESKPEKVTYLGE